MAYVRHFGKPDLFLTFTCNPLWEEIQENLYPGQSASARHELVARIFKQKLDKFIKALTKEGVFGSSKCHMVTIEWQKVNDVPVSI